jgi:hypothetical protein
VRLYDTSRRAVFLSAGLGHAFIALNDEATVIYLCSTPYSPGREHGVHPLDPDIGIEWPTDTELVMSPKDGAAPTLKQARRAGLLPVYADCETYLSSLRKAADGPSSFSAAAVALRFRRHHAPGSQGTQGLLVRVRRPFGDRGERARPGHHRAQRQAQDHRQPVAYPPATPSISHPGQHPQQARLILRSISGQPNQVADSRVNQ